MSRSRDGKPKDAVIGEELRTRSRQEKDRGDFTTEPSILRLVPVTIIVGIVGAFVALVLVWLIGFITHILYYQQVDFHLVSPKDNTLGWLSVLIPVVGGGIVGLMAKYGSERIRGHGIPEAMETILVGGSKVEPSLTILKPTSSAISIGTGGPFGAEGPIILTGGALGSVIAQFLKLSAYERRFLLVAGAAAGMSAVFGTPIAAVLLGIELLVFEWKPRSMVLIGLASAVADAMRHWFVFEGWMNPEPLFPVSVGSVSSSTGILDALIVGIASGLIAWVITKSVYGAEDLFKKLPIHWAWWPAIGGLAIGLGGLIEPRSLGVGYDTIADELAGNLALTTLISVFVVKLAIWAISLGSGTSGGILAPILMMGAAIGGMLGHIMPGGTPAEWAMLGMCGVLSGTTRSPFTAIVFALELTHNSTLFLPLLIVATLGHLISVLILKRSILTEKVARRGFHVLREYGIDPLDVVFTREVLRSDILTLQSGHPLSEITSSMNFLRDWKQHLFPVLKDDALIGVAYWQDVLDHSLKGNTDGVIDDLMVTDYVEAYPDETLREVAERMDVFELEAVPVVSRSNPAEVCGIITHYDLLAGRDRMLQEERKREQVLNPSILPRLRNLSKTINPSGDSDHTEKK